MDFSRRRSRGGIYTINVSYNDIVASLLLGVSDGVTRDKLNNSAPVQLFDARCHSLNDCGFKQRAESEPGYESEGKRTLSYIQVLWLLFDAGRDQYCAFWYLK